MFGRDVHHPEWSVAGLVLTHLLEGLSSLRGAVAFKIFKDLPHRNLKSVPGHTFETFKDVRLQATTFKYF